jgi:hypothetical protein
MGQPEITEDQRVMVVALLANAIRKDAHLRERADRARQREYAVTESFAIRRAEASRRYVDGMCDMVRVLFADGQAVVNDCLEDAYAHAMGMSPPPGSNGTPPV